MSGWARQTRRWRIRVVGLGVLVCGAPALVSGQTEGSAGSATRLDLTLLEVPASVQSLAVRPTMRQSLGITESTYVLGRRGIVALLPEADLGRKLAIGAFDALTTYLPGGFGWLHEEWHRAVLSRHGANSYNGIYSFPIFQDVVTVSRVRDEDLERLKRDHPADHVRLMSAGLESGYALLDAIGAREFFEGDLDSSGLLRWTLVLNSFVYVASASVPDFVEELTEKRYDEEGADVSARDFTGHDVTAWVRDLHRPDEPYAARGVHPSGVGVDRYVVRADLTSRERDYLLTQGRLSLLNLLDPTLFGIDAFRWGAATQYTFAFRHLLAPFGYSLGTRIMIRSGNHDLRVSGVAYRNSQNWYPGLDVEYGSSLPGLGSHVSLTPRLAMWIQPEGQRFRTERGVVGGLVAVTVRPSGNGTNPFVELLAKSRGWVPGEMSLEASVDVRLGLRIVLR